MGLFGRNKGGSGQNPLPTKGQIEAHMVKVGDKWVPKGFTCGSDVYYDKPDQAQTPPIPPIEKPGADIVCLRQATINFNVEPEFADLYYGAISDIVKRRTNYYKIEITRGESIKVTMLVSKISNDLINSDIERELGGKTQ